MQLTFWGSGISTLDLPALWVVLPLAQYAVCFFVVVALFEKRELIGAAWDATHRFRLWRTFSAAVLSTLATTLGRLSRGLYAVSVRVCSGRSGGSAMPSAGYERSGW